MSLFNTLQSISNQKEDKIFNTSILAVSGKDGHLFTKDYSGGITLTEENISEGKSVVTVKDNKGITHVIGENFR